MKLRQREFFDPSNKSSTPKETPLQTDYYYYYYFFFFKTIFKQWVLLGSLFMFVGQQIALSTMLLIRPFLVLMRLGLFPSPIFGPIHLKRTLEFGWVIVLSFNTPTHTHTRVLLAWEFWWLTRHIWYIRPMACRHEPMGMLHYCCQIVHGPNLQEFALIRSESLCHIYILKIKIQLIVQIRFFSSKYIYIYIYIYISIKLGFEFIAILC